MSELVDRLRSSDGFRTFKASDGIPAIATDTDLIREAADRIEELEAEVERQVTARAAAYERLGRLRGWVVGELVAAEVSRKHVAASPAGPMSMDYGLWHGRSVALEEMHRRLLVLNAGHRNEVGMMVSRWPKPVGGDTVALSDGDDD
jgi:tetrahydromethanopterin S-methyltransferase subunit G